MSYLSFGLVCEGTSDRAALPTLIDKVLCHLRAEEAPNAFFEWHIDEHAGKSSDDGIKSALQSRSYDIVLVHRDGAGSPSQMRQGIIGLGAPLCPVVPVRELEAWLIVDLEAITAATNATPNPPLIAIADPEKDSDPKATLNNLLDLCLPRRPRGRDDEVEVWFSLIADHVRLERLITLKWYRQFIDDLRGALQTLGWPFA